MYVMCFSSGKRKHFLHSTRHRSAQRLAVPLLAQLVVGESSEALWKGWQCALSPECSYMQSTIVGITILTFVGLVDQQSHLEEVDEVVREVVRPRKPAGSDFLRFVTSRQE